MKTHRWHLATAALLATTVTSARALATDCNTNCDSSCTSETCFLGICGTNKDPVCKLRCDAEKTVACSTGFNSCDLWKTSGYAVNYFEVQEAIRQMNRLGYIKDEHACHTTVDNGIQNYDYAGYAKTAYEIAKGVGEAFSVAGFIISLGIEALVKQFLHCACSSVGYISPDEAGGGPGPVLNIAQANRRFTADVNGDGEADFCRAIGDGSDLVCSFSTTSSGATDASVHVDDWGYADRRWMVDVNGDGKADFCRAVGNGIGAGSYLGCSLSITSSGAIDTLAPVDDWGYADRRWMVDVNGDGKADFCRAVGTGSQLACSLSVTSSGALDTFASVEDWGYADRRWMVDINADSKADFCRAVGNSSGESSFLGCSLSIMSSGVTDTQTPVTNWDSLEQFVAHRLYWQAGRHFRSGVLAGNGVDKKLDKDIAYDGRVIDEHDRLFAANGSRLYWQAGRHIRSGVLEGNGFDRNLRMDMAYDGPVIDENDRLFAANGRRLYWQAGRHFRSGLLVGDGVDKDLRMDMAYDGRVLDENDHLFAAHGRRLYWQAGRHFRAGLLEGDGVDKVLRMDTAYDGPVIDENDRLFAANGDRLYWQAGPHFRSGVLVGNGVDKELRTDTAYDGRVIDANDLMFTAIMGPPLVRKY